MSNLQCSSFHVKNNDIMFLHERTKIFFYKRQKFAEFFVVPMTIV
jgi:hypothetical protein